MAVEPRVRRVVAASLGCDATTLGPGTALHLDPIALLDVAQALENAFGVTLTEGELDRVRTCRDFASLIARRVALRTRSSLSGGGPPDRVAPRALDGEERTVGAGQDALHVACVVGEGGHAEAHGE